jgi:hypothetical protein
MKINLVKEICDACWLNQQDLAAFTGIKLQRIKDISAGRVEGFKSDDIAVMVEKLHLNPNWLLTGNGEIFKEGFSRSFPTKWEFVSNIIDRLIKIAEPTFYSPIADDVFDVPSGSASKWVDEKKIPYIFLKRFSEKYKLSMDFLIYGREEIPSVRTKEYELKPPTILSANHNKLSYDELTVRESVLIDDFRLLTESEKNAIEIMLHAVAKPRKSRGMNP